MCVALGAFVLTVGIAASAQGDVIDSATVSQTCNSYTIKVTGHALSHPNASVVYEFGGLEGFRDGAATVGVTDSILVTPKRDQTFKASATRPQPIPPFGTNPFGFFNPPPSATLITGAMTWNDVGIQGASLGLLQCPSLNKCPRAQRYWRDRKRWPVTGLVLGNLFPSFLVPSTFTYSNKKVRALLRTPVRNDESIELAHQLIAAKLNLFNGAPRIVHNPAFGSPSGIETIFLETTHADNLLGSLNNINPIPQHVDPASNLGQRMAIEAATLKSYNTGAFTPELPDDTCHDALE
jgi:hypothetical protein